MSFFYNLSTRGKLLTGFLTVIVLNLIVAIMTISSLNNVRNAATRLDEVLNGSFNRTLATQNAITNFSEKFVMGLNPEVNDYKMNDLLLEAPAILDKARSTVGALNPNFVGTQEYADACNELKSLVAEAVRITENEVLPLARKGDGHGAFLLYMTRVDSVLMSSVKKASEMFGHQNHYCISLTADAADSSAIVVDIILALAGALIGVIMAVLISSYIARSLSDQMAILRTIKDGDFSISIKEGYHDEFGQSQRMVKELRNTLSRIIHMTQEEAHHLKEQMSSLQDVSSNISRVSSDIQNQAVTVAAAADEMVSTTTNIARNCESAAAGSLTCKDVTSNGMSMVSQAVANIRQQSEHTRDNAAKIENLARQTKDIGSIVSTIDDIAAQTNLLALNAAIEAARAGEAGRGFAVVADEVRALASRTSKSTQEISRMVNNIQTEAAVATDSINASVTNMDTVAEDAQKILSILEDITNQVTDVNTQITQIADAAEQQTTATTEISGHMQSVTSVASDMSTDADRAYEDMSKATEELEQLLSALSYFKIREPKP